VTVSSVTVTPASQQYSDKVTFMATLSPAACNGAGSPATNVTFKVGTQVMNAVPIPLMLDGGVLKATLADVPLLEPTPFGTAPTGQMAPGSRTVTAVFGGVNPNFTVVNPTTTLTITQENASATYSGPSYFSTASSSSTTAQVTLSVTVVDVSDGARGDIRNAKVTFYRDNPVTGTVLGTPNLPVGLVNPSDTTTGTATTSFSYTLQGNEVTQMGVAMTVYAVVKTSNVMNPSYYTGVSDPVCVTITIPGVDNVSGGGYLVLQNSSGQYAGDPGSKHNFGFTMKYNKSGKNLQGQFNGIVRKNGRVYQIKSNAVDSLAVNSTTKTATFITKANMKDITDPLNPIDLGGNLKLQVDMTDAGQGGQTDTVGITLWNTDGGLYFSSNWNGTKTIQQLLGGGNISVRNGSSTTALAAPLGRSQDLVAFESGFIPTGDALALRYPGSFNPGGKTQPGLVEGSRATALRYDLLGGQMRIFRRTNAWRASAAEWSGQRSMA
jgi:hypothetical protein